MSCYGADLRLLCQGTHGSYRGLDSMTSVILTSITPVITLVFPVETENFYGSNTQHVVGVIKCLLISYMLFCFTLDKMTKSKSIKYI